MQSKTNRVMNVFKTYIKSCRMSHRRAIESYDNFYSFNLNLQDLGESATNMDSKML